MVGSILQIYELNIINKFKSEFQGNVNSQFIIQLEMQRELIQKLHGRFGLFDILTLDVFKDVDTKNVKKTNKNQNIKNNYQNYIIDNNINMNHLNDTKNTIFYEIK